VTPPASNAGAGGSGNTLALTAQDFAFSPTALTAKAGTVEVTITNSGSHLHSFTLDDGSVSQDIPPGTTQTVSLNLTGSVAFHCQYHPTQMMGTITVGGAAATNTTPAASTTSPRY
jgi:Copper binding proteins, plastocyanin/azurin family.